jgi:hypothetical protein
MLSQLVLELPVADGDGGSLQVLSPSPRLETEYPQSSAQEALFLFPIKCEMQDQRLD